MNTFWRSRCFYFLLMLAAMVAWGLAWPLGKIAIQHAPPQVAAFWRYFISFLAFIPVLLWVRPSFRTDGCGLCLTLLAGVLTAVFNWLFFAGLVEGLAGYGGTIVTTLSPILTYLLAIAIFRNRVRGMQVLGVCVGLMGGLILLRIPSAAAQLLQAGVLYFVLAAFVWSLITLVTQYAAQRIHILSFSFIVFGLTALFNLLFALPAEPFAAGRPDAFWWSIAFIGIVGGTFATTLYFLASGRLGAGTGGIYMFVVPAGAIASSYWMFGERPQLTTLIGVLFAFSAVFIFNFPSGGGVKTNRPQGVQGSALP